MSKFNNFLNLYKSLKTYKFTNRLEIFQKKYLFYSLGLVVFFAFYIFIVTQFKYYNKLKEDNFRSFLGSTEFNEFKENFVNKYPFSFRLRVISEVPAEY